MYGGYFNASVVISPGGSQQHQARGVGGPHRRRHPLEPRHARGVEGGLAVRPDSADSHTLRKPLAGFARATLRPGERGVVPVSARTVSYWDESGNRWVTPVGQVPVYIVRSRRDA